MLLNKRVLLCGPRRQPPLFSEKGAVGYRIYNYGNLEKNYI